MLALGLVAATTADATQYECGWFSMSSADVLASGLPAPPNASGSAAISGDTSVNEMCGTFSWSGVRDPVVFGHIHQAQYGQLGSGNVVCPAGLCPASALSRR